MVQLKLINVTKCIKKNVILQDMNICFKDSKIYGIRGKNGSGKTMLLRLISGLIFPTEGKIIINGKELHKDIELPENVGVLIENASFLAGYSAFDNLRLLSDIKGGISNEEIIDKLKAVGLNPDDKKKYGKFSLGMKQKLGIAYAILGEPDIILLDEPINALDDESVKKVKDVLIELKGKGKLIIVVCHDKEELDYLSDEIIYLKDGCVVKKEILNENI